jgi:hypothetical protein
MRRAAQMFRIMSNLPRLFRPQKKAHGGRRAKRECPWLFYALASNRFNEKDAQFFRALAQNDRLLKVASYSYQPA